MKHITTPFADGAIETLRAGERIYLSGEIFTARDAAHKRLIEMLDDGKPLYCPAPSPVIATPCRADCVAKQSSKPFDFLKNPIYYAGPCPAPPGRAIGSVGPTTSQRMDAYTPRLMREGLRVMIGKGDRSGAVIEAIKKYSGIYLAAIGGAGALISLYVEHAEVAAFEDLGPEAVYKLTVSEMPLVVAIDSKGNNIYKR